MSLVMYLLAAFGLAFIVGHSQISLPFRRLLGGTPEKWAFDPNKLDTQQDASVRIPAVPGKFGPLGDFICELIECPACFGFWIGFVSGLLNVVADQPSSSTWLVAVLRAIALGCITSGSNFILARLTGLTARP